MRFNSLSWPLSFHTRRWFRLGVAFLLAFAITLGLDQPSSAQFALPEGFGHQAESAGPPQAVMRYGNIEAIAVKSPLSDTTLFTIASPTVYDRAPDALGDQQPVERRAEEIRAKLLLLLNREMDSESLTFEVSQLNNVTIIDVRDDQHPRSLVLASVTEFDADFNGKPIAQLAEDWRKILEKELRNGLKKLPEDQNRVYQIVVGLLLITLVVAGLKYGLHQRQKSLRQQKQALNLADHTAKAEVFQPKGTTVSLHERIPLWRDTFLQRLQQTFSLDRRLAALDFAQWVSFWLLIFAWIGGVGWVYAVSPYLLAQQFSFLSGVLQLLVIWFTTGLAIRVSRRLIDRFTTSWEGPDLADFVNLGDAQRVHLRASTIAGAVKGLVTILILLVALLSVLGALGVPTASTVAIGSLVGLAVTFGSQNLVKDLVNGFLILSEDQYALGDIIDLDTAAGLVENLNMRVTQLRSASGDLVTVPNSSITQVKNLTRSWSRVNFSIDVAYQTDPEQVLSVMRTVAQQLYEDPEWQDKIVSEPNVLGIDSLSHSGMTLTTWIDTEPGQQWAVGRELRLRVRKVFEETGIAIGIPQQTYRLAGSPEGIARGRFEGGSDSYTTFTS
jgi:small-conductance mechanosensitive channel